MNGLWVRWECKEDNPKLYGKFDKIYLIINKIVPDTIVPKDDKELLAYVNKVNACGYKTYICINSGDVNDIVYESELQRYSKMANIVLDYIRFEAAKVENIFRCNEIMHRVKLAKYYCDKYNRELDMAVRIFPGSFLVGQNYWQMQKYGTILPMIYPEDCFGGNDKVANDKNFSAIKFHKWLFPKCEICLQAWTTLENGTYAPRQKEYLDREMEYLGNDYSIFRWYWYKKGLK